VPSVPFGLFDHVDRGEEPIGALFEQRLKLVEQADAAGFRSYHVAEHHATRLGMAPSPGLYLAAAAQRTRRIRLGPLVYIVPMYPPLRLIEEICMLDHLSGGRLELGVGRGISPYELAYSGINFLEAQGIFEEALEVILAGLRGGKLTHRGRHFQFHGVPMELEPVQRPHPPLWQGVVSPESAAAAARRAVNVVTNAPSTAVRSVVDAYFAAWNGTEAARPLVGMQRHVYVADTDEEALTVARPAYKVWYDSLTSLWRQFGSAPVRFADSLDRAIANDAAIVGSPDTVRAELARHLETSACTYFVGRFVFGTLGYERASRSLALFSREIMPQFAAGATVAAAASGGAGA
jgi:alkanesulfonate monooxygenase SsuD/methylene tetrahydromethanopterin reductase-like flavin-dependent oxidoreductase (luciferase family)